MATKSTPKWLEWAREIQQLCQTGLAFSESDYDTERYKRLTEIAAEITAGHTKFNKPELIDIFTSHLGYATPKIDIRAAIVKNSEILLVQEKMDHKWAMPGGWADVGEAPSAAIIRETKEETCLDIKPVKVIGVYDANRDGRPLEFFHAYKIVFLCRVTGGNLQTSNETIAVKYYSFNNIPELSSARTNQKHIDDIKKVVSDSSLPTVFDQYRFNIQT